MAQNKLLLILGNQLFPINEISKTNCKTIVMKEDLGLATDYFHHKLKVHMYFVAMREYRDELINKGFRVIYHSIDDDTFSVPFLTSWTKRFKIIKSLKFIILKLLTKHLKINLTFLNNLFRSSS